MGRHIHRPQRSCVVCQKKTDKRDLIRIVRTPEGTLIIDPSGKANGRGAYLCHQTSCWEKGLHPKLLGHALKVTLSTENITALRNQLQKELSKM